MFNREEMAQAAIDLCKDELRARLMAFKSTPLGQVVSRAGRRYIEAQQQGRSIDENDIVEFVQEVCEVTMGENNDG